MRRCVANTTCVAPRTGNHAGGPCTDKGKPTASSIASPIAQTAVTISLTDQPSLEQVKIWWADEQRIQSVQVYTDLMPRELDDFLDAVGQGHITLWMFLVHHGARTEVGGLFLARPGKRL